MLRRVRKNVHPVDEALEVAIKQVKRQFGVRIRSGLRPYEEA
jgi:hypothetical protein